ncbi:MAG: hypothetical protein ING59_05375 [Burkholderiales bacterium]|nr:hypothetical protein [Burkholderiales bacterium]
MKTLPLTLATIAALVLALPVGAEEKPKKGAVMQLDKDGDGRISREEAKGRPRLEKGFDTVDTNKDGFLSQDELAAARKKVEDKKAAKGAGGA